MSEDLNEQVIVAFFESAEKADAAADALINWDKANDDIKLGTVGRITHGDEGKLETKHYGNSHSRRGALIGVIAGAAVMRCLYKAIVVLGIPQQWEMVIIGAALMMSVVVDEVLRRYQASRRL